MNPHQQMRPEFDRGCIDMGGSQNYCRSSEMCDFLTGMTGFPTYSGHSFWDAPHRFGLDSARFILFTLPIFHLKVNVNIPSLSRLACLDLPNWVHLKCWEKFFGNLWPGTFAANVTLGNRCLIWILYQTVESGVHMCSWLASMILR